MSIANMGPPAPKCAKCGSIALKGSAHCKWHQPDYVRVADRPKGSPKGIAGGYIVGAGGQHGVVPMGTRGDFGAGAVGPVPGYDSVARTTLLAIARDVKASPTARTHAARALAELDGYLGKHQQAPDRTADSLLSSLSRADLVRELARLRARSQAPDIT
jgi:hypothetical protein